MEIRSKEATVQLTVDGQRLGGSFNTIMDLQIKPDADIAKKRFPGEKRASGDLDVKGYDFSFKNEKRDHTWFQLWKKFEQADTNGTEFPTVSMAITFSYRGGARQLKTITLHGNLVLKLDDDGVPADGYLSSGWSGYCSYLS
jgi:hypothetical protein